MDKLEFQKKVKENPFGVLGDLVYDYLFEKIITMQIFPGARLHEAQIANELGISRSPIRAAIDRLIEEKLVLKQSSKYPYIAPVTPEDWIQMTHARIIIESKAGYFAAQNIDDSTLERLKTLAAQYDAICETPDLKGFEQCDHDFHQTIVNACGNPYIIEMYNTIDYRVLRYRYNLRHRIPIEQLQGIIQKSSKSHWTLIFLLEKGLSMLVRDEIETHLDVMRDIFAKW